MTCEPTIQTNEFDDMPLPSHLQGLVAPVAVWRYIKQLQRRVAQLEARL